MFELKPLHKDAILGALAKSERYRLLNEPWQAESICRDILRADPGNQQAQVTLLLALTEQFEGQHVNLNQAREVVAGVENEYERTYYTGIIYERWGTAMLHRRSPGHAAYDWLRKAMEWFEKAEAIRPPHNDDAALRWNTCVRLIQRHNLQPADEPAYHMEAEA